MVEITLTLASGKSSTGITIITTKTYKKINFIIDEITIFNSLKRKFLFNFLNNKYKHKTYAILPIETHGTIGRKAGPTPTIKARNGENKATAMA